MTREEEVEKGEAGVRRRAIVLYDFKTGAIKGGTAGVGQSGAAEAQIVDKGKTLEAAQGASKRHHRT